MKPRIAPLLAAAATLAVGSSAVPGIAFGVAAAAESDICRIPERVVDEEQDPRRVPNIQPATWKRLQQAQELITAEQYTEGIDILQAMVPREDRRSRYNANELGQIHNMLGYGYWELFPARQDHRTLRESPGASATDRRSHRARHALSAIEDLLHAGPGGETGPNWLDRGSIGPWRRWANGSRRPTIPVPSRTTSSRWFSTSSGISPAASDASKPRFT